MNEVSNNNLQVKIIEILQKLNRKIDQSPNPRPTKRHRFENATDTSKNRKISIYRKDGRL